MSGVEIFLLVIAVFSLIRVFGMMTNLVKHESPTITPGQQASQVVYSGVVAAFAIGFIIT